jgi:hypothetical protein
VKRIGVQSAQASGTRTSEHDRAFVMSTSPLFLIGSKMNHVEQNLTNEIVALEILVAQCEDR